MYDENYLAHYGILGMRWGIRRYQPYSVRGRKSGETGREIGEARKAAKRAGAVIGAGASAAAIGYGSYRMSQKVDKDKLFTQSVKGGKDKPPVSPAEKIASESGKIVSESGKIYQVVKKGQAAKKGRESKTLTEEELRRRISRLELEKRYEDLTAEDVSRGKVTAKDILDSVGSVFTIAGSAATVYAMLKYVRKA